MISLSILNHFDASGDERAAYLKRAVALRRAQGAEVVEEPAVEAEEGAVDLSDERFEAMRAAEQIILTVSENGYGKRSSSFEYRITGRGGSGIVSIATSKRNGDVVASFPVGDRDQVMMITDAGRLIRIPIGDVRVAGRATQGVTLFATGEEESVTSVAHLPLEENGEGDAASDAGDAQQELPESGMTAQG